MEVVFAVGVIVVGKLWIRLVFRKDQEIEAQPVRSDQE
jgi:hypothetical protein